MLFFVGTRQTFFLDLIRVGYKQGHGFRVASSEVFGWSRCRIKNSKSRSRILYSTPTPEVKVNHFLHRTPKLRVLRRTC